MNSKGVTADSKFCAFAIWVTYRSVAYAPEGKCACELSSCVQIPSPGCCHGEDFGFILSPLESTSDLCAGAAGVGSMV